MTALGRLIVRRRLRVPYKSSGESGYWTLFGRVRVGALFWFSPLVLIKTSESRGVFNDGDELGYLSLKPEHNVMVYDVEDVEPYPELPEGLYFLGCKITANCQVCHQPYEWYAEIKDYADEYSYCCRGPSCTP